MSVPRTSRDDGFTLVELLVVVVIIGLLAAIATPIFMRQRTKAADAALQSDLGAVAVEVETWMADHHDGPPTAAEFEAQVRPALAPTAGDEVSYAVDGDGYCLTGVRAPGAIAASHPWIYRSQAGGLQPGSITTC